MKAGCLVPPAVLRVWVRCRNGDGVTDDRKTAAEANLQLSEWYDDCVATGADPVAICTAMVSAGVNIGLLNQPDAVSVWATWLRGVADSIEAGEDFPPIGGE